MQEHFYESGNCVQIICATLGVHPKHFSPTSVQFKSEINDALPRKRHQKRHLEFCTAYLLSRGSGVRISPGAPLTPSLSVTYRRLFLLFFRQQADCHKNVLASAVDPSLAKTRSSFEMNDIRGGRETSYMNDIQP